MFDYANNACQYRLPCGYCTALDRYCPKEQTWGNIDANTAEQAYPKANLNVTTATNKLEG